MNLAGSLISGLAAVAADWITVGLGDVSTEVRCGEVVCDGDAVGESEDDVHAATYIVAVSVVLLRKKRGV